MNTRSAFLSRSCLLPVLLVGLAACKSTQNEPPAPPPPLGQRAQVTNEFEAAVQVVSVDAAARRIVLRREDGNELGLTLGEDVRNFAQIAAGDVVRVRYQETLVAEKLPAGTDIQATEGAFAAGRAPAGAKPGAGAAAAISVRVRVESVDREHDIVAFSLASGELLARRLRTQEGRAFAASLKVGDLVQLAYAEGVAIAVQKP